MNRYERLGELMDRHGLDAVVLRRPANLAWYKTEETFVLTESGPEIVAGATPALV